MSQTDAESYNWLSKLQSQLAWIKSRIRRYGVPVQIRSSRVVNSLRGGGKEVCRVRNSSLYM